MANAPRLASLPLPFHAPERIYKVVATGRRDLPGLERPDMKDETPLSESDEGAAVNNVASLGSRRRDPEP
jgi:hypothetical protein